MHSRRWHTSWFTPKLRISVLKNIVVSFQSGHSKLSFKPPCEQLFHSSTRNMMGLVLLEGLQRNFYMVSPCKVLVLECPACTPVHSFSIFDRSLAVYIKNNINPLTWCCFLENPRQGRLCHLCKGFVVAVHFLDQAHPINDAGRWGCDVFCRKHILSKLSGECSLVCFS